ncbi:MAG: phospho-N-acetylmuramoyl-pentapeptide-transferase, partial [Clostridia bacterium]|nr:phospho-N-acetylmuramoyl-pentapeptide-transferase [Clostridia bacterium]
VFFLLGGTGRMATVSISIGLAFMVVGFLDDFIKIKLRQNQGLKAYQKIIFQLTISILIGLFCFLNGITIFYLPFVNKTVSLGVFTIPIVALIFIAVTNSVNLTDGLDGLSSNVSLWYLVSLVALCVVQLTFFGRLYLRQDEYKNVILLCCALIGGILGFLVFNTNKAKVFMGDTGSLSLGGFIGALTVFTSNAFYMPILGICLVLSSVSVIVQVLYYKRTKKRIFLMAPFHHHLQMKGYTETQISYFYSLITVILGVIAIIFYF